jgi:bifunctional N-acetylglucosamine-1-phosphate-uridyltransferase/glucosamine-1-phosphate-acetyltransferase GlmU-like protein
MGRVPTLSEYSVFSHSNSSAGGHKIGASISWKFTVIDCVSQTLKLPGFPYSRFRTGADMMKMVHLGTTIEMQKSFIVH